MAFEVPLLSGLKVTLVIANNMFKFIKLNLILNLLLVTYPKAAFLGLNSLLYIYINDLAQVSEVLFTILFADDTTVTIQSDNESVLINTFNIELEKLNIWLLANKLIINVSKSHYMIFHRRRRKIDINNLSLNNTVLQIFGCHYR